MPPKCDAIRLIQLNGLSNAQLHGCPQTTTGKAVFNPRMTRAFAHHRANRLHSRFPLSAAGERSRLPNRQRSETPWQRDISSSGGIVSSTWTQPFPRSPMRRIEFIGPHLLRYRAGTSRDRSHTRKR